jgi:hypothetical protein
LGDLAHKDVFRVFYLKIMSSTEVARKGKKFVSRENPSFPNPPAPPLLEVTPVDRAQQRLGSSNPSHSPVVKRVKKRSAAVSTASFAIPGSGSSFANALTESSALDE